MFNVNSFDLKSFIRIPCEGVLPIVNKKENHFLYISTIKQYKIEFVLLVYLLLRFFFKNILGLSKYFTTQPIFIFSETFSVIFGTTVLLVVCIFLAFIFGRLIRKNGQTYEKPVLILVALFFACPSTLPFLFDTDSLSGTQMLYPFALFLLAVYIIGKRFAELLVPGICIMYSIPTLYTSGYFFTALRKGAILYVPLILLFLFLDIMKNSNNGIKQTNAGAKADISKNKVSNLDFTILGNSFLFSAGSYIYTLMKGNVRFDEKFYAIEQKINIYFLICLLITAPFLIAFGTVLYYGIKNRFSKSVFYIYLCFIILLFPLFWNNYYGLWIPFLTISLSSVVFFNIWQKNPKILSATNKIANFFTNRQLLFYFLLIVMASLSNTSSSYVSVFFVKFFSYIPF